MVLHCNDTKRTLDKQEIDKLEVYRYVLRLEGSIAPIIKNVAEGRVKQSGLRLKYTDQIIRNVAASRIEKWRRLASVDTNQFLRLFTQR